MRMYESIDRKKRGYPLSEQEIRDIVAGYVAGDIPDYQMAAFLMAVYFSGMNDAELLYLTDAMAHSGDMVDLSAIEGIKVDKHSTGGVGDKTTLIIAPIVAACGGKVAKMSGRGLGFTGGTVDKLEAIPGYDTALSKERFFKIVNEIGLSVIGQTGNIAPADKKLYALRDVTATVDSIPLIASSVMSKKLAAGSDKILLDVTAGSGAFMKDVDQAVTLAEKMVAIGEGAGRETVALITDMDVPLGRFAGNILEVKEAIEFLCGNGAEDLRQVCRHLAANMLYLGKKGSLDTCFDMVDSCLADGSALKKLEAMVAAQGGDISYIQDISKFDMAPYSMQVCSPSDGYVYHMNTEQCGITAVILGAGRETKDSPIDGTAGIEFIKKTGDTVRAGESLAVLYSADEASLVKAKDALLSAYRIEANPPQKQPLIIARVTKDGVVREGL